MNHISKSNLENIYRKDQNAFAKSILSDKDYVVVSKLPVEISDVRFRLSLFYSDDNLKKATLVAVAKQNSEKYIGRTCQEIHEMWLRSWMVSSYISELYGIRYELDDTSIVAEHDPRSGSDVIVVKYIDHDENPCFKKSRTISDNLIRDSMGGIKIPHSTSQPVVYYENGTYYLAIFTFLYSKNDIEQGLVSRPSIWAIADIETGEIINEYETKDKDFSDAPYDVKYNVRSDAKYDTSKEYYDKAFAILDSVREKLIKTGKLYKAEYQAYLDRILANIPKDYQRFYRDLSV